AAQPANHPPKQRVRDARHRRQHRRRPYHQFAYLVFTRNHTYSSKLSVPACAGTLLCVLCVPASVTSVLPSLCSARCSSHIPLTFYLLRLPIFHFRFSNSAS